MWLYRQTTPDASAIFCSFNGFKYQQFYEMRMARVNISVMLLMILPVILVSCHHIDDYPETMSWIDILFEWDKARNAEIDGMTLYFYPIDGHNKIWRFDIAGRNGGRVELPYGIYRMIACNNDLPGVGLEDTGNASTIRATAKRRINDGVYASTGMLYVAVVDEIEVSPSGVSYMYGGALNECDTGLVRCQPDSMSTQYTVDIGNVTGINRVRSVAARFGNVGESIFLNDGHLSDSNAWLYLVLTAGTQKNNLSGSGCAFSVTSPETADYHLSVSIVKTDGKSIVKTMEIKRENMNIITAHNVIITIDGIDISDDDGDTSGDVGGIGADVDGWNVIEIDLDSAI